MTNIDKTIEKLNEERNTINAELRKVKAEHELLSKAKVQIVEALERAKKEKEEAEAVETVYLMLDDYNSVNVVNNYKESRKEVRASFKDALGKLQTATIYLPIQSKVDDETVKEGIYRVVDQVAYPLLGGF